VVDDILYAAFVIVTAVLGAAAIVLIGGLVRRLVLARDARKRLAALEALYRGALSGPIGDGKSGFPGWARAMVVAARNRRRMRLALWVEPALSEMAEMAGPAPQYVIPLCADVQRLVRDALHEANSHEADVLELVADMREHASKGLRQVDGCRERAAELLAEERFAMFDLAGAKRRTEMLLKGLTANDMLVSGQPDAALAALGSQAAVVTGCCCDAVKRSASAAFLAASWDSILLRLDLQRQTFGTLRRWAELLADEGGRTAPREDELYLTEIRAIVRKMTIVTDVCKGSFGQEDGTRTAEALYRHCVASHAALRGVENRIREAIGKFAAAAHDDARLTLQ